MHLHEVPLHTSLTFRSGSDWAPRKQRPVLPTELTIFVHIFLALLCSVILPGKSETAKSWRNVLTQVLAMEHCYIFVTTQSSMAIQPIKQQRY